MVCVVYSILWCVWFPVHSGVCGLQYIVVCVVYVVYSIKLCVVNSKQQCVWFTVYSDVWLTVYIGVGG